MSIMIPLKNVDTDEIRIVKLGFSWTLFLFSGAWGIPLFFRGFYIGGTAMFLLSCIWFKLSGDLENLPLLFVLLAIQVPLEFHYGFSGNELTAKKYLNEGWEFLKPDSKFTKMALRKWNIADESISNFSNDKQHPVLEGRRQSSSHKINNEKEYPIFSTERQKEPEKIFEKHYINIDNKNSGINKFTEQNSSLTEITKQKCNTGDEDFNTRKKSGVDSIAAFKVIILVVFGLAITAFLLMQINQINKQVLGIFPSFNGAISEGWKVTRIKDKFTDEVNTIAYNQYPIDDGKIEVAARCVYDKDNTIMGKHIDFNFTMLSNDKNAPKTFSNSLSIAGLFGTYTSSGLLNASGSSANPVEFDYRLESGNVRKWYSNSEYNNVAKLSFFEKERISVLPAYGVLIPSNSESLENLLTSKILRIKLPVKGENPADIEIKLSGLHDFFAECFTTNKITQENSSGSSANKDLDSILKSVKEMSERDLKAEKKIAQDESDSVTAQNSNCNNSRKSTVEILVCSDLELSALDSEINTSYKFILRNVNEQAKEGLKTELLEWKKNRSQVCDLKPMTDINENESNRLIICLKGIYSKRLSELQTFIKRNIDTIGYNSSYAPSDLEKKQSIKKTRLNLITDSYPQIPHPTITPIINPDAATAA